MPHTGPVGRPPVADGLGLEDVQHSKHHRPATSAGWVFRITPEKSIGGEDHRLVSARVEEVQSGLGPPSTTTRISLQSLSGSGVESNIGVGSQIKCLRPNHSNDRFSWKGSGPTMKSQPRGRSNPQFMVTSASHNLWESMKSAGMTEMGDEGWRFTFHRLPRCQTPCQPGETI